MESILLASSSERGQTLLSGLLLETGAFAIARAHDGREARAMIAANDYALLLVNAPLRDESGFDLAERAARESDAGVLLLAHRSPDGALEARMEAAGVLTVEKPLIPTLLKQAVRHALAARSRVRNLQSENARLQSKLDEVRLAERAKNALIRYLGMSEAQAHRYLEKQAMDLRLPRAEVAKNVLKNYSL